MSRDLWMVDSQSFYLDWKMVLFLFTICICITPERQVCWGFVQRNVFLADLFSVLSVCVEGWVLGCFLAFM